MGGERLPAKWPDDCSAGSAVSSCMHWNDGLVQIVVQCERGGKPSLRESLMVPGVLRT